MSKPYPNPRTLALYLGPFVAFCAFFTFWHNSGDTNAAVTLGVTLWVVIWWVFEPIPIPATSLLPMALLPLFGVLSARELGAAYGNPLVLLMLGGFLLATALERSGAHRRIALYMVRAFGGNSSRRLVFGFMCASAFLSMWISNTSTTLMLLPVALAALEKSDDAHLAAPLLLGIAYAASILRGGGLVAFPTETVYGLGADACNANAVASIFTAKNRPEFNPMISHVATVDAAFNLGRKNPIAAALAAAQVAAALADIGCVALGQQLHVLLQCSQAHGLQVGRGPKRHCPHTKGWGDRHVDKVAGNQTSSDDPSRRASPLPVPLQQQAHEHDDMTC